MIRAEKYKNSVGTLLEALLPDFEIHSLRACVNFFHSAWLPVPYIGCNAIRFSSAIRFIECHARHDGSRFDSSRKSLEAALFVAK